MKNEKNIYNYTKTEINKIKREQLLKLKYEQDRFYFESASASNKNWHENNSFKKYCQGYRQYTIKDFRETIVTQ